MFTTPFAFMAAPAGGAPLILDDYPSAAFAMSVRKLRSAYAGSSIRVRRSSDNAEQDIGFVGENLDTSSLISFCGAGDGFVKTWYDQSGNARNFTQTTNGDQPKIVASGAVLTLTGIGAATPQLEFSGTDILVGPNLSGYTDASIFCLTVQRLEGFYAFWNLNDNLGGLTHHLYFGTVAYEGAYTTDRKFTGGQAIPYTNPHIWAVTSSAADYKVSANNLNFFSSATNSVQTSVTSAALGAISGLEFPGSFQEVISWYSNEDVNRPGIIGNMNTYFQTF